MDARGEARDEGAPDAPRTSAKRVAGEAADEQARPEGISEELWERFQATRARVAAQRARRPPPKPAAAAPAVAPAESRSADDERGAVAKQGKRRRAAPHWTMEAKARWERKGAM